MKEVLSVFTFGIKAQCFVVFVTDFKPNVVSTIPAASKPVYSNTEAWTALGCRSRAPLRLGQTLLSGSGSDRSRNSTA
jgi:hypothetical protein